MEHDEISASPHELTGTTLMALALAVGVTAGLALGIRLHAGAGRAERRVEEYMEGLSMLWPGGSH